MGFLTSFRGSKLNSIWQKFLRVLQFLSSVISLSLFASRLAKVARLAQRASASWISHAQGAVVGILAVAVVYTLIVMIMTFAIKHGGPKWLRWLLVAMDLGFMAAFIAVSYLTRPAVQRTCHNTRFGSLVPKGQNCNLPWGTFVLAIISTYVIHTNVRTRMNADNLQGASLPDCCVS